jgi:ABC-type multidrug transport system ATPase subunit
MLTKIEDLKKRIERIDYVNRERLRVKCDKDNYLLNLYKKRESLRRELEVSRFIIKSSAEYYKLTREENLSGLGEIVGEFMENVLDKKYEVKLGIKSSGNYDYLDAKINGLEPRYLSGGESQAYSLAMISESMGNGILVLDETTNSLDPIALNNVLSYLNKMSEDKQIFIIELDENFGIPCKFIVENGNITKEDKNDIEQ